MLPASNDSGQDLVEYALLAGFLSIIAAAAAGEVGAALVAYWGAIIAVVEAWM